MDLTGFSDAELRMLQALGSHDANREIARRNAERDMNAAQDRLTAGMRYEDNHGRKG